MSPYIITTVTNSRQLFCAQSLGCNYPHEEVIATCPPNYLRINVVACLTPEINTFSATVEPPEAPPPPPPTPSLVFSINELGCVYTGNLSNLQSVTIGTTITCITGVP